MKDYTWKKGDTFKDITILEPVAMENGDELYKVRKSGVLQNCYLRLIDEDKEVMWKYEDQLQVEIRHKVEMPFFLDRLDVNGKSRCIIIRAHLDNVRTLQDVLDSGHKFNWNEVAYIAVKLSHILSRMHGANHSIILNALSTRDICILGEPGPEAVVFPKEFSNISNIRSKVDFDFDSPSINPWYMPQECFEGFCCEASDVFGLGALMFHLLTGEAPWYYEPLGRDIKAISKARYKKLWWNNIDIDGEKKDLISKTLHSRHDTGRVKNVAELRGLLNWGYHTGFDHVPGWEHLKKHELFDIKFQYKISGLYLLQNEDKKELTTLSKFNEPGMSSGGFHDVAGMEELKEILRDEVLFIYQNREVAKQYKLKAANGMLLYGPPGCGKTFFAEKFAEESGMTYKYLKGSDMTMAGRYGDSEINSLFRFAEQNAPCVLCFDEMECFVPARGGISDGNVSEFLVQLNNCSERGIFVIGTTNFPDMLDPAILRSGRIDIVRYVSPPEADSRKILFEKALADRPQEDDLDLEGIAENTGGFSSSDITRIINRAALIAAKKGVRISNEIIYEAVNQTRKSISEKDARIYEQIRQNFEEVKTGHVPVGFHTPMYGTQYIRADHDVMHVNHELEKELERLDSEFPVEAEYGIVF